MHCFGLDPHEVAMAMLDAWALPKFYHVFGNTFSTINMTDVFLARLNTEKPL